MRDCWIEDPDDRPSFVEIVGRIAAIIEANVSTEVEDLRSYMTSSRAMSKLIV